MRNILLTISYDGTDFCGWQRQDCGEVKNCCRTVQGEIEKVLEKIHKEPVTLYGSGRTDSGVHALAQSANFISNIDSIPVDRYPRAINSFLPQDIRITAAEEVPMDFNARFSATSRVYRYFICPDSILASQTRTITGTLINLDRTGAPVDSMEKILFAKDRKKAGATAPAQGLFLYKIKFDGERVHP